MANESDNIEVLKSLVYRQAEAIKALEARLSSIEEAYIKLNQTYNNHIAGLHVQRIG